MRALILCAAASMAISGICNMSIDGEPEPGGAGDASESDVAENNDDNSNVNDEAAGESNDDGGDDDGADGESDEGGDEAA